MATKEEGKTTRLSPPEREKIFSATRSFKQRAAKHLGISVM
jgi:hypothetical protein